MGKDRGARVEGRSYTVLAPVCFCLALAAACNPASPDLPATLTLAIGQTASAGNARVTFVDLVSDSRCPIAALCIQAGDAVVRLAVRVDGKQQEFELTLRDETGRSVTLKNRTVTLDAVDPYPTGQPIPPAAVRATIAIK
jgi:hypothetical protein